MLSKSAQSRLCGAASLLRPFPVVPGPAFSLRSRSPKEVPSEVPCQIETPAVVLVRNKGSLNSGPAFLGSSRTPAEIRLKVGAGCPSFGGQRTVSECWARFGPKAAGLSGRRWPASRSQIRGHACAVRHRSCTLVAMQFKGARSRFLQQSRVAQVQLTSNTAPNHSFERTCPGVPVHAAQLKRWVPQAVIL
jgi:hypothetical protein